MPGRVQVAEAALGRWMIMTPTVNTGGAHASATLQEMLPQPEGKAGMHARMERVSYAVGAPAVAGTCMPCTQCTLCRGIARQASPRRRCERAWMVDWSPLGGRFQPMALPEGSAPARGRPRTRINTRSPPVPPEWAGYLAGAGFALRCWLCSASADVKMGHVYGARLVAVLVVR